MALFHRLAFPKREHFQALLPLPQMLRIRTLVTLLAISVIALTREDAVALVGSRQPPANGFPPAPWALAHRGASGVLPEHSVGAYVAATNAVSVGCVRGGRNAGDRKERRARRAVELTALEHAHVWPATPGALAASPC